MVETEVENILREIRERVLSQPDGGNGACESDAHRQLPGSGNTESLAAEQLALINSYLTTTARAWDKLPPVASNRSGLVARLELWLKRRLKRATHWFTWEQVNFNAAVHQAHRDMLQTLTIQQQKLQELQAQIDQFPQRAEMNARIAEMNARHVEMVNELRERDERVQDQQRVCFKQLSLQTSEAAVLEDRARRKNQLLLEELQHRLDRFEKGKE